MLHGEVYGWQHIGRSTEPLTGHDINTKPKMKKVIDVTDSFTDSSILK